MGTSGTAQHPLPTDSKDSLASPEIGGAVIETGMAGVGGYSGAPGGFSPNGHWVAALPQEYGIVCGGQAFPD